MPTIVSTGVCDLSAFEHRLQSFFRHCGAKHRRQVEQGLLSGNDRLVWEARLQRLMRVETYPERMFKVQLDSSNKSHSQHRATFWLTYAHLAQRQSQARPPQVDITDDHSIEDGVSIDDSTSSTLHPAPLPPSTVTSASASSSSSSSASPVTSMAGNRGSGLPPHSFTSSESSHGDISPSHAAAALELNYEGIPLCLKCYTHVYPFVSLTTLTD